MDSVNNFNLVEEKDYFCMKYSSYDFDSNQAKTSQLFRSSK